MRIRKKNELKEIIAGDNTKLIELLHPDREYQFDGRYSLAVARLAPGQRSKNHFLKSNEVYYIISGQGKMHINQEEATVTAEDVIEIPPGAVQSIENTGIDELKFLCIVDPAWQAEDETIID